MLLTVIDSTHVVTLQETAQWPAPLPTVITQTFSDRDACLTASVKDSGRPLTGRHTDTDSIIYVRPVCDVQ